MINAEKNCAEYSICLNNSKCLRCYNKNLLKTAKKLQSKPKAKLKVDKDWKRAEQETANFLNDLPTIESARRSRRSGAMWFEKGDVIDNVVHIETKTRQANKNVRENKQSFSIKREWIEKAAEEAQMLDKPLLLTARFKDDPPEKLLGVMLMSELSELITHYKVLSHELEIKDKIIEKLQKERGDD